MKEKDELDEQSNGNLENGNAEYSELIVDLKQRLARARSELNETDANYPHIQAIIDKHWDD